MKKWKLWLPDMVAVVLFAVIAFAYFYPADVENRILFRHDSSAGLGAGQEASEFLKQTGERTRWSNSIFGGMPTYQTAPSYDSTDALQTAVPAFSGPVLPHTEHRPISQSRSSYAGTSDAPVP